MAFQLKTAAFPANGRIPEIYTCEGEDVPPPLVWSGAPAGTKSFAMIVDDPDAPGGTFCHWAIFDIGPAVTNVGDEIPLGAHQAVNDFSRMGYGGPRPPPGHLHHYRFRLMAIDVAQHPTRPSRSARSRTKWRPWQGEILSSICASSSGCQGRSISRPGRHYPNYGSPIELYPIDTGRLRGTLDLAAENAGAAVAVASWPRHRRRPQLRYLCRGGGPGRHL
jgi:Raf kinase inhibitor-like YbhB/YbcL family protein